jgi:hypothetical protein
LLSRTAIQKACNLDTLNDWFLDELKAIPSKAERDILSLIHADVTHFVRWPEWALLLWEGCHRSKGSKIHTYPETIKLLALEASIRMLRAGSTKKISLDRRINGPAVAAYQLADGVRPPRLGSKNCWSVHHIYSGKFPYPGKQLTMHAARDGRHCTQSAGLVAVHPIADQACDEYPAFAWLLRATAFQKFGYDPDEAFSSNAHDQYGFVGKTCSIFTATPVALSLPKPPAV